MLEKDYPINPSLAKHKTNRAIEHLLGLVTGLVADGQLNNLEIVMLSTWISSHPEVTNEYPGSIIALNIEEILKDGVITDDERSHLLKTLFQLASTDFISTGSATDEVVRLPVDDDASPNFINATVCFTGDFVFGTRSKCWEHTEKIGAQCTDSLTKKVNVLVVGTNVSKDWIHTSFGRKIQQAVELRNGGHDIYLISEKRWLDLLA